MANMAVNENKLNEASNPTQLAKIIDQNKETWEEGRKQLYNGCILAWLRAKGHQEIIDTWAGVADKFKDNKDAGLEAFLQLMDPNLRTPQIEVKPKKINILGIQPGQIKDIEINVANWGRGHVTCNIELTPAIPGVSVSPDTININEKFNKSASIHLKIDTTNALKGKTELWINTNAGEIKVPVSYQCVFPLVLLYPWLSAITGFLAYYYLFTRGILNILIYPVFFYNMPFSFVIALAFAITIPAGLVINSHKKTHRLMIPNLISALIAVVLLNNGILPEIGTGFLFYVIIVVALYCIIKNPPLNGLPFTTVLGAYGTNWLLVKGVYYDYLPPLLFNEKMIDFNKFWVPAAIFAFTGYGFGQWALDRVKLSYIQKPARTLHYTGAILMGVFLFASVFYSYPQYTAGSIVTVRQTAIYDGPSTSSNQIRTLPAGSRLKITSLKITNSDSKWWYNVEFENNGFIHKSQLKIAGSSGTITSDSGSNLRLEPVIQPNNIITVVPKGKVVNITKNEGDWYKVSYSETGYVPQAQIK